MLGLKTVAAAPLFFSKIGLFGSSCMAPAGGAWPERHPDHGGLSSGAAAKSVCSISPTPLRQRANVYIENPALSQEYIQSMSVHQHVRA